MSTFISTVLDPFGFGFGEALTGKDSAFFNVSDNYGMKGEKGDQPPAGPGDPNSNAPAEGVLTDTEAQAIAKKKFYRSGSVYTSTLGEDITDAQTSHAVLR